MNKVNTNDEISRVKALMNYGLHTESNFMSCIYILNLR